MSSNCYVLNDWLIHDLRGDNGKERQEEARLLLEALREKCDQLAMLKESSWMRKAYELTTHQDTLLRVLSRLLHLYILRDSNKFQLLHPGQIVTIPEHVRRLVPEEDIYLFEAYYSAKAEALVTTDEELLQIPSNAQDANIIIRGRDDFIDDYLLEAS